MIIFYSELDVISNHLAKKHLHPSWKQNTKFKMTITDHLQNHFHKNLLDTCTSFKIFWPFFLYIVASLMKNNEDDSHGKT